MITWNECLNNKVYSEECSILKQLNDIVQNDPSWSEEAKEKVNSATNSAIGALLYVGVLIENQDDLK